MNVTANPSAAWVRPQLREAFPFDAAPRYLLIGAKRIDVVVVYKVDRALSDFAKMVEILARAVFPRMGLATGRGTRQESVSRTRHAAAYLSSLVHKFGNVFRSSGAT